VSLTITTESGTRYEFNDDLTRVKRDGGDRLRRDGEWLSCSILNGGPTLGDPLVFALEPLGDTALTIRSTTPVVRIDETHPHAPDEWDDLTAHDPEDFDRITDQETNL